MDNVNVLVVSRISEESKREIEAVSPKIKLWDSSHLWDAPPKVHDEHQKEDFSSQEFDAILAQAEVIYGFRPPKNVVARAPRLKWYQNMLAGVDYFLDEVLIKSPVTVTNMSGIHATPVSEVVMEMILMLAKQALTCFYAKQKRQWQRFDPPMLPSKTVGIVGLGNIGREVARLAKAFRMRVIATRKSVKKVGRARHVDLLLPKEQLPILLSESDFVVLTLPSTPETYKLIREKELKTMKPTAYIINVGRGDTLDEEALIRALEENWIAGAALDTFNTEPLPKKSKLWELPNLFLSAHVSGRMQNYDRIANKVFCENLRRYLSGEKLLNVVDKKRGY